jgi:uncharacterized membrane protein YfcA
MLPLIPAEFSPWQWALLFAGGLAVGLSKTGVPGIGILFVAVFANILPARASTGVVLPLLILGDLAALALYRREVVWSHVVRLLPWAVAGIFLGWWALGRMSDAWTARAIGLILLLMLGVHAWRHWQAKSVLRTSGSATDEEEEAGPSRVVAAGAGVLGGFATLVANAAGPVMSIYLLAMRLPKREFLGTGAVYFFLINWFKVPFMVNLDLINVASLRLNLWLAPAVLVGAWLGARVAAKIEQKTFETLTLAFAALAAVRLLLA